MIKHSTASVFVFTRLEDRWRLGLIDHPRLGRKMIVGGHVEADENEAEAALRETGEESGLVVRLLPSSAPGLPAGYPHRRVAAPWWITEVEVGADSYLDEPHVHIDHQYVAVADSPSPVSEPAHPFTWYAERDLHDLVMFPDTRMLATVLFAMVPSLVDGARLRQER